MCHCQICSLGLGVSLFSGNGQAAKGLMLWGCTAPPPSLAAHLQAGKGKGAHTRFLRANLPWEANTWAGVVLGTLQACPHLLGFPPEHLDVLVPPWVRCPTSPK